MAIEVKEVQAGLALFQDGKRVTEPKPGNCAVRPVSGGPFIKADGQKVLQDLAILFPGCIFLFLSTPVEVPPAPVVPPVKVPGAPGVPPVEVPLATEVPPIEEVPVASEVTPVQEADPDPETTPAEEADQANTNKKGKRKK